MKFRIGIPALVLIINACWCTPSAFAQNADTIVTIAVPDVYLRNGEDRAFIGATVNHLNTVIQGHSFRIQAVSIADLNTQIELLQPDFFISPPWGDMMAEHRFSVYNIVSRKSSRVRDASHSVGSLIVTLKTRNDINRLSDLKGKTIAGGLSISVPMWMAAMNEFVKEGLDYEKIFAETYHFYSIFPDVISTLWGGQADAAVLPTCALEQLEEAGLIAADTLKVVNDMTDDTLACRRSTELFPDFGLLAFNWTDRELVRRVTVGMLTYRSEGDSFQWEPFVSQDNLDAFYKNLEIGPYSYLRNVSIKEIYRRNKSVFHFIGFALGLILVYSAMLQVLVRRRTADLSRALKRQRKAEQAARSQRERLGHLERRNVVNQMSGMIAHEIKSPVGAICNFVAALGFLLPEEVKTADVKTALTNIEGEAQRIAGIVDRVRNYAKSKKMAHIQCDLVDIARKAVVALHLTSEKAEIKENYQVSFAYVKGDPLELELMILNLLRNASEVTPLQGKNVITLSVRASDDQRWQIVVSDRGAPLSDEAFQRLTKMMESVKPEGLGMGLSIVRGIADSHAAKLEFKRNLAGGLNAVVTVPPFKEEEKSS